MYVAADLGETKTLTTVVTHRRTAATNFLGRGFRSSNETNPGVPSLVLNEWRRRAGSCSGNIVSLQISIRKSGDITILDLCGRSTIDAGESELLDSHLQKLVAKGVRRLLLNLAGLTQIDSSGLSVIVGTCVSVRRQGGDLRLLRPNGSVLEVFRVLRLADAIPSFQDEAQALASFRSQGSAAPAS